MKIIEFRDVENRSWKLEVGKRLGELTDVVTDILIIEDGFVVVYGALFKVYKGVAYEYTEMHAMKNPYQYTGRDKNI